MLPDDPDDRLRAWIALGVAMAEAEAIWQLRQRAMRWAAEQPMPPLDAEQMRDGVMQVMAELDALRERRRQAADHIERLVREAARDAEADRDAALCGAGCGQWIGQHRTVPMPLPSGRFARAISRFGHFGRFGQLSALTLYMAVSGFRIFATRLPSCHRKRGRPSA